jgi:hypothetical protein
MLISTALMISQVLICGVIGGYSVVLGVRALRSTEQ